jgi:hypothetical protein
VNVRLAEVVRGTDSKLYPARQLPEAELARIRGLEHALHCRDGLSVRSVQRVLAESYAVRRSTGAISQDLTRFSCQLPRCPSIPVQPATQPAAQEPPVVKGHQGSGPLTGMLADRG